MKDNPYCYGLFVDTNDTLYCSMFYGHQVVKKSLADSDMTSVTIAAGTGTQGPDFHQLNNPRGIFVDADFNLYIADSYNDRIQLWLSGESIGMIVAGSKSPSPTINLYHPAAVVLDAENYLFIVDSDNHRIVRSGSSGSRCLVGCYGKGSQSNQMNTPMSLSFDRSGNMFVVDVENSRTLKFLYAEIGEGKLKIDFSRISTRK